MKENLYFCFFHVIIVVAFLRGLEKAPTFLVPIINPPFADNSPHLIAGKRHTLGLSPIQEARRIRKGSDERTV